MKSGFITLEIANAMRGNHSKQLFYDALSALAPWATKEPFETVDRAFSQDYLERSPFKRGVHIKPREIGVFGSPSLMFSNSAKADAFQLPISFSVDHTEIKDAMHKMFYRAQAARDSGLFAESDFGKANAELKDRGSLSHGYRKTSHIIATELVLRLVKQSVRPSIRK